MSYIKFDILRMWKGKNVYKVLGRGGEIIGTIEWYPTWQQYIFTAYKNTIWSWGCLQEISNFLREKSELNKSGECIK